MARVWGFSGGGFGYGTHTLLSADNTRQVTVAENMTLYAPTGQSTVDQRAEVPWCAHAVGHVGGLEGAGQVNAHRGRTVEAVVFVAVPTTRTLVPTVVVEGVAVSPASTGRSAAPATGPATSPAPVSAAATSTAPRRRHRRPVADSGVIAADLVDATSKSSPPTERTTAATRMRSVCHHSRDRTTIDKIPDPDHDHRTHARPAAEADVR